jgi:hypothetical protein
MLGRQPAHHLENGRPVAAEDTIARLHAALSRSRPDRRLPVELTRIGDATNGAWKLGIYAYKIGDHISPAAWKSLYFQRFAPLLHSRNGRGRHGMTHAK